MSNDSQLLAQARQLDPTALRVLHQRFYGMVARYVQFKVGDPQTVEDLTGEVFVRIIEGLKRGKGWEESAQGWIMGITRNIVADYYRRRERVTEVELGEHLAAQAETNPLYQALLGERRRHLLAAIQQLTDEQRDVVVMRFIEGMNIESVAKAINKTPGAVKGLQYRAIRTLAEIMQDFSMTEGAEE